MSDSSIINVRRTLAQDCIIGYFFFAESIISEIVYFDMLELHVFPRIEDENMISQQDGAPPSYANFHCDFLDEKFPQQWIGSDG